MVRLTPLWVCLNWTPLISSFTKHTLSFPQPPVCLKLSAAENKKRSQDRVLQDHLPLSLNDKWINRNLIGCCCCCSQSEPQTQPREEETSSFICFCSSILGKFYQCFYHLTTQKRVIYLPIILLINGLIVWSIKCLKQWKMSLINRAKAANPHIGESCNVRWLTENYLATILITKQPFFKLIFN